jgi:hypothetical protein
MKDFLGSLGDFKERSLRSGMKNVEVSSLISFLLTIS